MGVFRVFGERALLRIRTLGERALGKGFPSIDFEIDFLHDNEKNLSIKTQMYFYLHELFCLFPSIEIFCISIHEKESREYNQI